jgi:hypothetical protein
MTGPLQPPYEPTTPQPVYPQPTDQQPYAPQPGYPQPYPTQPGYQQPGYQQPGYQPAGYQQPGYQQPGYQPAGYPPPVRKSHVGLWITLGVVLVVVIAAAAVGLYTVGTKTADSASTNPRKPTKTVHLTLPATLNGLQPNTDPTLTSIVTSMNTQLRSVAPGATDTIGGFYGSPTDKSLVMLIALAAPDPSPATYLSSAITGLESSVGMASTTSVPAGPLGGSAECGQGEASDVPIAVCAWADSGSFGVVAFYYKQATDVQAQFLSARGQAETQS